MSLMGRSSCTPSRDGNLVQHVHWIRAAPGLHPPAIRKTDISQDFCNCMSRISLNLLQCVRRNQVIFVAYYSCPAARKCLSRT